jgi:hypothetical protein
METPRKRYRSAPFNPVLDLDSFLSLTGADVVEPDPFAAIIGEMWCTGPSIAGSPIHEPASSQVEAVWPLNDGNSTENAEGEDGEVEALSDMCETDELEPAPQLGLAKTVKRKSKPPPGPHEHGVPSKYTCFRNKICSGKVVLADNVPLQHGDTAKCCKDGHLNAYCAVCDGFLNRTLSTSATDNTVRAIRHANATEVVNTSTSLLYAVVNAFRTASPPSLRATLCYLASACVLSRYLSSV